MPATRNQGQQAQQGQQEPSDLAKMVIASGTRFHDAWYAAGIGLAPLTIAEVTGIPTNHTADIPLTGLQVGPPVVSIPDWTLVNVMNATGAPGSNELVGLYDIFEFEFTARDNTDVQLESWLANWAIVYGSGRINVGYNLASFATPAYGAGPAGSAEVGDQGGKKRLQLLWPGGRLRLNYKTDRLILQNVLGTGIPLTSAMDMTVRVTRGLVMTYDEAQRHMLIGPADTCAPPMADLATSMGTHRAVGRTLSVGMM